MNWASRDEAAERAIDVAAAAIFAAATAFAVWALAGEAGPVVAVAAAAAAAFLLAYALLRALPAEEPSYVLPAFEPAPIEFAQETRDGGAELLLDDRLTRIDPGARVVQLFGPKHGPAASDRSSSTPADASEALSEALAELRRLLR